MSNKVIISDTIVSSHDIQCKFSVEGDETWKNCFKEPYCIKINYNHSIENTPKSIAIIPVICNFLPIVWIFNAELIIDEVDKAFFESIPDFKNGYINMYPDISFKGKITVKNTIENNVECKKSAVLFSGGVDAFNTLISNINENPELITLWGADVAYNNNKGWKVVENQIVETSEIFNLKYNIVHTNFRDVISSKFLYGYVCNINKKYGWWHDFAHGIGIISHSAPLAYSRGIKKVYIASSFTKNDIGNYTCASDPTIDNYVKFGSSVVIHDGYEFNRQMKINNICKFSEHKNIKIPIRVCWESTGGTNCCKCEKCFRTMMGIIAEGKNPKNFGFELYNEEIRKYMLETLKKKFIAKYSFSRYSCIQKKLVETYSYDDCPEDLKWFYKLRIRNEMPKLLKISLKCYRKLKSIIKR